MLFSFALEDLMVDLPLDIVEKPFENGFAIIAKELCQRKTN
jgi:hypothetical protein